MKPQHTALFARRIVDVRGFSLIELMVSVVLGMIGILVVMQVFALAEERRRTTTSGSDAQMNGLIAGYTLQRDIAMAGFGTSLMGCTTINTWNETATPQQGTLSALPVKITQNTPTGTTNDELRILYSSSGFGAIPATIQQAMPSSSAIFRVDAGIGFSQGDLVVVAQPGINCSRVQLTQDGQATGTANVTGPGTMWNLQHNPGGVYTYNPPGGSNIFPTGGYGVGAKAFNLGKMVNRAYYVENNSLMMRDLLLPGSATNPLKLADGVFALRAQYGRDTDNDGIVNSWDNTDPTDPKHLIAVRYAIVTRSGQYEKEQLTTATTLTLWNGGPTVALLPDPQTDPNLQDQHYRYKIYQTTVPLRNAIWGKS